jgi:hypothetical protein
MGRLSTGTGDGVKGKPVKIYWVVSQVGIELDRVEVSKKRLLCSLGAFPTLMK